MSHLLVALCLVWVDGPQDNIAEKVRPVPPPGIEIPADIRKTLQADVDHLGKEIEQLKVALKGKPALLNLLPDVQIFHRAVHDALAHDEFHDKKEFATATKLIQLGLDRAKHLREGKAPWTTATGLVVRGYRSKIDDSVQPYGLVVPASFKPDGAVAHRLDLWFHGRGEKLTELNFLTGRLGSPGEFTPKDAFVLHPYGRYCNANHFAGEIDTFEAIAHMRRHYPLDMNRVVVRGFSMGGAACWNVAVHYPGLWVAAAPGAGFSETPDFLKVFQKETLQPTWYEKKLFHLYDCTDWALNLSGCPTVAYSGTKDSQKQAADVMAAAMAKEGLDLTHILGPGTGHSYHPAAKIEINRRIDAIAQAGRSELPRSIRFVTYSLRYPTMRWLTIDRMTQHWTPARIDARITGDKEVVVKTRGVEAFTLDMGPGLCPLDPTRPARVVIDGSPVAAGAVLSDHSWKATFARGDIGWTLVNSTKGIIDPTVDPSPSSEANKELAKRPGLTGPIDDAFMDRFLMVRPTGAPLNDKTARWVLGEMKHAQVHWRRQFRGDAPIKDDVAVTEADIASSNLVLWGDPSSNLVLKKIADKLPIAWTAEGIRLGKAGKTFAPGNHVVAMIYPNPLNPNKYVVLNSGFTFREYDYLNNARQIPKLPDWVVFDIDQPSTPRRAAGIADAAFFGERWEMTNDRK